MKSLLRPMVPLDVGIAVAFFALFTLPVVITCGGKGPSWAIVVLGIAAAAPLAVRRRLPLSVLVAVTVALAGAALGAVRFTPFVSNAGPALSVAVYSAASAYPRRTSLMWSAGALFTLTGATVLALAVHPVQQQDAVQWLLAVPAWLAGDAVSTRRSYRAELERQQAVHASEREARIRAEERLRVSRDVHDVVSHTLSMIAVRSAVARLLADRNPSETREALTAIETASRNALDELRSVLGHTRDPARPLDPPEPALSDLPQLAQTASAAGLDVQLNIAGGAYSPTLETTVYRIVQESLTNVVKHAMAHHVSVDVEVEDSVLRVVVSDDGVGRPPDAADGIGTAGMKERVELFHGSLDFGPHGDGLGHRVIASFPLGP